MLSMLITPPLLRFEMLPCHFPLRHADAADAAAMLAPPCCLLRHCRCRRHYAARRAADVAMPLAMAADYFAGASFRLQLFFFAIFDYAIR